MKMSEKESAGVVSKILTVNRQKIWVTLDKAFQTPYYMSKCHPFEKREKTNFGSFFFKSDLFDRVSFLALKKAHYKIEKIDHLFYSSQTKRKKIRFIYMYW